MNTQLWNETYNDHDYILTERKHSHRKIKRTRCLRVFTRWSPFPHLRSCAVFRCMGAAMICHAWMSSAVLYWVVSHFLARLVERKCYSVELEDPLWPFFKVIAYSRLLVRNGVNIARDFPPIIPCLPVSFNFIVSNFPSNIKWRVSWTVPQTFTCDLMTYISL